MKRPHSAFIICRYAYTRLRNGLKNAFDLLDLIAMLNFLKVHVWCHEVSN